MVASYATYAKRLSTRLQKANAPKAMIDRLNDAVLLKETGLLLSKVKRDIHINLLNICQECEDWIQDHA